MKKTRVVTDVDEDLLSYIDKVSLNTFGDNHRRRGDTLRLILKEAKDKKLRI